MIDNGEKAAVSLGASFAGMSIVQLQWELGKCFRIVNILLQQDQVAR
jgi:hypothetical protein